jgi:hypothetical protein
MQNNNEAVSTSDVDTLTVVVDTLLPPPATYVGYNRSFQKEI